MVMLPLKGHMLPGYSYDSFTHAMGEEQAIEFQACSGHSLDLAWLPAAATGVKFLSIFTTIVYILKNASA